MRLTAKADDLKHSDIIKYDRDHGQRQRSKIEEIKVIFSKMGLAVLSFNAALS
jgi:hypothetical protein